MKEINLHEILENALGYQIVYADEIIEVMREACNQAIDLCLDKSRPEKYLVNEGTEYEYIAWKVKESSILRVKEAIK